MRFKIFNTLLVLALAAGAGYIARAQDGEEEAVRGSFLTTRVNSSAKSGSSLTQAVTSTATTATGSTSTGKSSSGRSTSGRSTSGRSANSNRTSSGRTSAGASVSVKSSTGKTSTGVKASGSMNAYVPSAIGLGYTLYMRDASGNAVRVDPSREFGEGDRIRLSLESNTDGYLYIFHTENDGVPQMLYPDVRLGSGNNKIQAHVPYEIPWNEPGVENWFKFDANPARERLYVVVTREPLPGIPTGSALVSYCGSNRCPWQPPSGVWVQVKTGAQAKVGVVKTATYGQAQSGVEREATTRGLGLSQEAPEPSVIRMNVSSNAPVLVTAVDLIHK